MYGVDKGSKRTYALLDERVPPMKELHKEEALAKLAIKYFRSHSPASLQDFIWWSGLSITEAKQAVGLIDSELITERMGETDWLIHNSCARNVRAKQVVICYLRMTSISSVIKIVRWCWHRILQESF